MPRPWPALLTFALLASSATAAEPFSVTLRSRPSPTALTTVAERWAPEKTAVIVCDMWDLHHCLNATRRGAELAPRMDAVLKEARARGALIIHAPSDCMATYETHPARLRMKAIPKAASLPTDIAKWCYKIPAEEAAVYPIDQTDGGEDDEPGEHERWQTRLAELGRNPKLPWKAQTPRLEIDAEKDLISDKGDEIWGALESRKIENVILMGVHLNMCVLGRPFGLRRMAENGKHVVLMRDMTDTMYNPLRAPHVSHFSGTDLIIEHIERLVCPTITSDQLIGGVPFRFRDDTRPRVALVMADDEYDTARTLPEFATSSLRRDHHVTTLIDPKGDLPPLETLADADVLILSVRRKPPTAAQRAALRTFVAMGKPIVALRTSSHAFAPRAGVEAVPGVEPWPEFDAEVLGGSYHGHHGPSAPVAVAVAPGAEGHAVLTGVGVGELTGHGTLYRVRPLAGSATPLLVGSIAGEEPEPLAWTHLAPSGSRVFYTSLGHPDDFAQPAFRLLLRNAVRWAVAAPGVSPPPVVGPLGAG